MVLRTRAQWWGVTLDAPGDVRELSRFYSRLLDWELFADDTGDSASVAPSKDAGYNLGFQAEAHHVRPVWPAQPGRAQMSMHLEIQVDDLDEAVAHAVSVGAEIAAHQPQATVRVMLDPPGTRSASTSTTRTAPHPPGPRLRSPPIPTSEPAPRRRLQTRTLFGPRHPPQEPAPMHRSRLSTLLIDTPAEQATAGTAFWSAALGVPALSPPGEPQFATLHGGVPGLVVAVQSVDAAARFHVDIETDDVAAEVARLTGLGAVEMSTWQGCRTLQVPGGHLLCVIPVHSDPEAFSRLARTW